jgi:1-acyl-sn-glycerol-3-phosphate acyltransferase
MKSYIAKLILRISGWKITGKYPEDLDKLILIAAPHTSWLDFFIGITVRAALGQKIKFVGKHTLFKGILGWIMRMMGGIPVDRTKSTNFVQAVADLYNRREKLSIIIAPEGTRKKVSKFKTGFYFIAKEAKIPILLVKFNYPKKEVHLGPLFYPTENSEKDLNAIEDEYRGVIGKIPEFSFS